MPGLVPIRCDGYEMTQAPGGVTSSDCQNKSPRQVTVTPQRWGT